MFQHSNGVNVSMIDYFLIMLPLSLISNYCQQFLDMKENEMQSVLNRLGHTLDIQKIHYRYTQLINVHQNILMPPEWNLGSSSFCPICLWL